MEINNVSGAYTSAAKVTETDDEKETKKAQEEEAKEAKVGEKDEKDTIEISQDDDYGESGIEEKAKNAIEKCITTAKPVSLDYMNPYERFIVHEVVMADGRVTSESFGKEPRRFVKIFIK